LDHKTTWIKKQHGLKNNIDITAQASKILQALPIDAVFQNNKQRSLIKQLKHARKHLINSRLRAQELREEHLDLLQEIAIAEGNMTKAKAVRQVANK
jgi:hypothetical protein